VSDPSLQPDQEPWTTALKIAPGVALAILGAAVRLLRGVEPFSFRAYVAGMATAAFAGLLVSYYLEWANVTAQLRIVIVGMSGYIARDVLDAAARYCRTWMKNKTNELEAERKPAQGDDDAGPATSSGISLTIRVAEDATLEQKKAAAKAAKAAITGSDTPPQSPTLAAPVLQTKPTSRRSMRTPRPE
jgi:hypothetical protein